MAKYMLTLKNNKVKEKANSFIVKPEFMTKTVNNYKNFNRKVRKIFLISIIVFGLCLLPFISIPYLGVYLMLIVASDKYVKYFLSKHVERVLTEEELEKFDEELDDKEKTQLEKIVFFNNQKVTVKTVIDFAKLRIKNIENGQH